MERIQSINPERIAWCCADFGMTPVDLASALSIAEAGIERVMNRKDGLTFHQLSKLAAYFDKGVLFFIEEGPVDEVQAHTPQFRTIANQKSELSPKLKSLIERVEKQRELYLNLREDLEDLDFPGFSPPDLSGRSPREAAEIARAWLGLSDRNNFDSYREAVESKGVLVFQSNGYNGKWQIDKSDPILGFMLYDPVCPVIVIKKQRSDYQQSFTLMHEFGHLLLHKDSSIDQEEDFQSHESWEIEANSFAGNLLVPDSFLADINISDKAVEIAMIEDWLKQQCRDWGVSSEVILRRLLEVKRLSREQYSAYREWKALQVYEEKGGGSREYRYREPMHMFGDTFVRTVLQSLNSKNITLARASGYLDNLKIADLHKLERYYAGL